MDVTISRGQEIVLCPPVKLEGGATHAQRIEAIVQAGIPFMAHIGMLPQSVREEGGYKLKGRTQSEIEQVVQEFDTEPGWYTGGE